jgi:hypothetical protein
MARVPVFTRSEYFRGPNEQSECRFVCCSDLRTRASSLTYCL